MSNLDNEIDNEIIAHRHRYSTYWRDKSDWYWLWRVLQELAELIGVMLGIHKDTTRWEKKQIASIMINWIDKNDGEAADD